VIENSQYRRRLTPFHAHKQNNELIKEEEWVIGITGNPNAFLRTMVAVPELSRMVKECEYAD